ncbi:GNAT family N-acetyltransferase [Risungbinella massiliensis]|uniref:GNAT family N-acetyltransferase n=1 Tax=Risungbinella massiliensis TaxID=1329796 RepID=UPI0005CC6131|nr:hypothetical protein [Risungbinella massiliensis]
MLWIREAKPEDHSQILSLIERANLSTRGAVEEPTLFFVVEGMVEDKPVVVGTAGMVLCGDYGLFRSFVLEKQARSEKVILELIQILLRAASDAKLDSVYLITSQPSDWLQALCFYPIEEEEVPFEVACSIHFSEIANRGNIFSCSLMDRFIEQEDD